ncbi:MAG: hypothetical protein P1Q69_05825 [Candidatus Thorarchaeota archaeon]|nr:hypothetical protein [Candidatus Thorarchaeota archaeon]
MDFIKTIAKIKDAPEISIARLLVLLQTFEGPSSKPLKGLTKLAKIDFLLRYPVYLERALEAIESDSSKVKVTPVERNTIESKMIRYKYGPWDPKHRNLVNLMVARGFVTVDKTPATSIKLTEDGFTAAQEMMKQPEFEDITRRAKLLKSKFNKSGTWLKNFIYETFPEILTLQYREEIEYE